MKVIGTSNYDVDTMSDIYCCTCDDEYMANHIALALTKIQGEDGDRFFKVVPDDHKLYTWEP